jgi:hypothetical protein
MVPPINRIRWPTLKKKALASFDCSSSSYAYCLLIKSIFLAAVTGEKLAMKDLVKLNFTKNDKGEYHCPVWLLPLHRTQFFRYTPPHTITVATHMVSPYDTSPPTHRAACGDNTEWL